MEISRTDRFWQSKTSKNRKRDRIGVIDIDAIGLQTIKGLQCSNCKQRSRCVPKAGDINNVFCLECGNVMPLRKIKRSRGLAVPSVQESTAVVQNAEQKQSRRKPKTITENRRNDLADTLTEQGYTVIDSQVVDYA